MRRYLTAAILLACLATISVMAYALPAASINYQGKLTDATGQPVADGSYAVTFRLFACDTGGTASWESTTSVQTMGGIFSTIIGPIASEVFANPGELYLELGVNGSTLAPRTRLVSTPFSVRSNVATVADQADLLDDLHAGSFMRSDSNTSTTGMLSVGSNATVSGSLQVVGAGQVSGLFTADHGILVRGSDARFQSPLVMENLIQPQIGNMSGLAFPSAYGGDAGDAAYLRYYPSTRGATAMNLDIGVENDLSDRMNLIAPGGVFVSGGLDVSGDLSVSGSISGAISLPDGSITGSKLAPNPSFTGSVSATGSLSSASLSTGPISSGSLTIGADNSLYFRGSSNSRFNNDGTYTNYWGPNALRIRSSVTGLYNLADKQYWGSATDPQGIDYYLDGSNNLKLFFGTTQVGDISANDTNWLRINQNSDRPIYTPRLFRADGGFYVGGTTYGIDVSGNVIAPTVDATSFRDRDNTTFIIDPNGSSRVNNLTVSGTLTATLSPTQFDDRYLLKTGDEQLFSGDIINTSGGNYRNPRAASMGCISSQMFSSLNYFGASSTDTIYVGESNPVRVPGYVSTTKVYDIENTAYYVDPAGASSVNSLNVAGALTVGGSPVRTPIAYAHIGSTGTVTSGTSNVTCVWSETDSRYEITIAGEYYSASSYVTTVTPSGNSLPRIPATTSSLFGGKLIVTIYDLSGNKVQSAFQFTTFKP